MCCYEEAKKDDKSRCAIVGNSAFINIGKDLKSIDEVICNSVVSNKYLELSKLTQEIDYYNKGYKCMTYIDKSSRLCILSADQILNKKWDIDNNNKQLITCSNNGCPSSLLAYETQLRMLKKAKFASPMLFTNSICNIPNSLMTIQYDIRGMSNHLVGDVDAAILALWQATKNILANTQSQVLVSAFETMTTCSSEISILQNKEKVFCESKEGAVSLLLKDYRQSVIDNTPILGVVLGFGFSQNNDLDVAVEMALSRSQISENDITVVIDTSNISRKKEVNIDDLLMCFTKDIFGEAGSVNCYLAIAYFLFKKEVYISLTNKESIFPMGYRKIKLSNEDIIMVVGCSSNGNAVACCIQVK